MKSIILLLTTMPLLFLAACSDPEKSPTAAQTEVSVHPEGWGKDTASPNFHGKFVAARQYDARECQPCHGNINSTDNKSLVGVTCRDCHESFPHRQGWNDVSSSSFHGKVLAAVQFDATTCQPCHGSDYNGGTSTVSCKTCHASFPHPTGWVGAHRAFIKSIAYDLNSCQACHGQNYGTVKVDNSCLTCHTKPGGPEACNTCHGDFGGDPANLTNVAPPKGLNGETSSTTPAVGAHQPHFAYFSNLSTAEVCQQCHALPTSFAAAGHIDPDGKAELLFNGELAKLKTEGGARVPNPAYNRTDNTCAGAYCHGNWGLLKSQSQYNFAYTADRIEGSTASPKWTDANTAACGTCHDLPPAGHLATDITLNSCTNCHGAVVDANGKIIDNTKHINGQVNVFFQEYPMF